MTVTREHSYLARVFLLGCWLVACVPGTAKSQDLPRSEASQSDTSTTSADVRAIEAIALARRLSSFGERTRSPLALITAAQILIENPMTPHGPGIGSDSADASARDEDPLFNVSSLLTRARALSGGDVALGTVLRRLDAASHAIPRGTGTGPRQRYERIAGGAKLIHNITFVGKLPAVVYVGGDGGTNLELGVYNSQGKLVTSDVTRFGDCLVKWLPERSDRYRVEVRNRDGTPDWFLLITN